MKTLRQNINESLFRNPDSIANDYDITGKTITDELGYNMTLRLYEPKKYVLFGFNNSEWAKGAKYTLLSSKTLKEITRICAIAQTSNVIFIIPVRFEDKIVDLQWLSIYCMKECVVFGIETMKNGELNYFSFLHSDFMENNFKYENELRQAFKEHKISISHSVGVDDTLTIDYNNRDKLLEFENVKINWKFTIKIKFGYKLFKLPKTKNSIIRCGVLDCSLRNAGKYDKYSNNQEYLKMIGFNYNSYDCKRVKTAKSTIKL